MYAYRLEQYTIACLCSVFVGLSIHLTGYSYTLTQYTHDVKPPYVFSYIVHIWGYMLTISTYKVTYSPKYWLSSYVQSSHNSRLIVFRYTDTSENLYSPCAIFSRV